MRREASQCCIDLNQGFYSSQPKIYVYTYTLKWFLLFSKVSIFGKAAHVLTPVDSDKRRKKQNNVRKCIQSKKTLPGVLDAGRHSQP